MDKETIQKKKSALEVEFKTIDETRRKALTVVTECVNKMTKLQGAYEQLTELEKELDSLEKTG